MPSPTITSIQPPTASVAGTLITINGTNFLTGASVYFGSLLASSKVISNTVVTASVPVGFSATSDVKVYNSAPYGLLSNGLGYQSTSGLVTFNSSGHISRRWADETYAASCYKYISPASGYAYSGLPGVAGNGVYTIQPNGYPSADVTCDMTSDGGGWTLVVNINSNDVNHRNSSAVNSISLYDGVSKGKFSDAFINAIKSTSASTQVYRFTCQKTTTPTPFYYWSGACVFNGGTNNLSPGECAKYWSVPSGGTFYTGTNPGDRGYGLVGAGTGAGHYYGVNGDNGCGDITAGFWSSFGVVYVK